MLSSALFFAVAKVTLFLRALAPLLQERDRQKQKAKLLSILTSLKRIKFGDLAAKTIAVAGKTFSLVAGNKIFSLRYVVRCASVGALIGMLLSGLTLLFIAKDLAQALRLVHGQFFWNFIFMPSVLVASVLAPVDIACAHILVRWGARGGVARNFTCLFVAVPLAYGLWAIGAGLASIVSMLISSGFFIPFFVINRIVQAFLHPVQSSASMQLGTHWFSYGLLAASSALSSLLVSVMFCIAALIKLFPESLHQTLATPIFWFLDALSWFSRKNIDISIQTIAWSIAVPLLVFGLISRTIGF